MIQTRWLGMISTAVALAGTTVAIAQAPRPPSGSSLYEPTQDARPAPGSPGTGVEAAPSRPPASNRATTPRPRPETRAPAARGTPSRAPQVALDGRWQDRDCVPLVGAASASPLFVKRSYEFDDKRKRWEMTADVFSHDRCRPQTRLLTYQGSGTYAVTGVSRIGSNVYEASFAMESWQATPHSREGTLALFNARCGAGMFDEGRLIDLARSGCPLLAVRPLARAPTGSELLRVADGKIYLGVRSNDAAFADERPTQVSEYGLTRL